MKAPEFVKLPFRDTRLVRWPDSAAGLSARWVSPQGTMAIAGGRQDTLLVHDWSTEAGGRCLGPLADWVGAVCATPDGRVAISAGGGRYVEHTIQVKHSQQFWDDWNEAREGEYWPPPDSTRKVRSFEPRDYRIWVWDVERGDCIRHLAGHTTEVIGVALSADGGTSVSIDHAGTVRGFRVGSGNALGQWLVRRAVCVAVEGGGKLALIGTEIGGLHRLDLERGKVTEFVKRMPYDDPVTGVALSADGRFAASATTYGIKLWEAEGPHYRGTVVGRDMALYQIVTTPDGCRILAGVGEWVHAREISLSGE